MVLKVNLDYAQMIIYQALAIDPVWKVSLQQVW